MKSRRHLLRFLSIAVVALAAVADRAISGGPASPLAATGGGESCANAVPIGSLPFNDSGSTTSASNDPLFLSSNCSQGLGGSREGRDVIYSITVFAGNSLTIQVDPDENYDVAIYLLSQCGNGFSCTNANDSAADGGVEAIGPVTLSPGTHFLYIDSVYGEEEKGGFGTYTLSVTGSLGVPNNTSFFTVTPCRVLDTRDPPGPYGQPALAGSTTRAFTIHGRCGIPPTAKSISINATVTQPTAQGFLTLFPTGAPLPLASTINFRPGQTRANNAIVPLSGSGSLSVFAGVPGGQGVHFLLDVNGYFQ